MIIKNELLMAFQDDLKMGEILHAVFYDSKGVGPHAKNTLGLNKKSLFSPALSLYQIVKKWHEF